MTSLLYREIQANYPVARWLVVFKKKPPSETLSPPRKDEVARFYKVDASRAAESTGTIGVTSRPGRTTFTMLLPQLPAQ